MQSFNDKKLQLLGRSHDSKRAIKAIKEAQKSKINNISIDIMYATILDDMKNLDFELSHIKNFDINHISSYSLTLEENTPFFTKPEVQDDNEKRARYLSESLKNFGFTQYEISNFAKDGKTSKHNLGYWSYHEYLGCGCGAVGFRDKKRYYGLVELEEYIQNPLQKNSEALSEEDIRLEMIFLGLRSKIGVDKSILNKKEKEKVDILLKEKKLTLKDDTIFCNDYFLADELTLFIQC